MQVLNSWHKPLGPVALPYKGRQAYFLPVELAQPSLPTEYADYLPTVVSLCAAAGFSAGTVYLTVDEKVVPAGMSQRRPGPHVDGCFSGKAWVHPPTWNHYCNHLPVPRMAVIVAASAAGCRAWTGKFQADPRNDGDLSHVAHQLGSGTVLPADQAFLLSPDCVHESMVYAHPTQRTFMRIALPVQM